MARDSIYPLDPDPTTIARTSREGFELLDREVQEYVMGEAPLPPGMTLRTETALDEFPEEYALVVDSRHDAVDELLTLAHVTGYAAFTGPGYGLQPGQTRLAMNSKIAALTVHWVLSAWRVRIVDAGGEPLTWRDRLATILRHAGTAGVPVERLVGLVWMWYGVQATQAQVAFMLGSMAAEGDPVGQPIPHGRYVWTEAAGVRS